MVKRAFSVRYVLMACFALLLVVGVFYQFSSTHSTKRMLMQQAPHLIGSTWWRMEPYLSTTSTTTTLS